MSGERRDALISGVGFSEFDLPVGEHAIEDRLRDATTAAIEDAGRAAQDIDAVIVAGTYPDAHSIEFPELWLADSIPGQSFRRVPGGWLAGLQAVAMSAWLIASRQSELVLVVAGGLGESWDRPGPAASPRARAFADAALRASFQTSQGGNRPIHAWREVTRRNRQAGAWNRRLSEDLVDAGADVTLRIAPLRACDLPTPAAGACAVLVEGSASASASSLSRIVGAECHLGRGGAFLDGLSKAAGRSYRESDISDPLEEIDVWELHAAASSDEPLIYEALFLTERGHGVDLALGQGPGAYNPSGGSLCADIGPASTLARVAECHLALQDVEPARRRSKNARGVAAGTDETGELACVVVLEKP